MIPNPKLTAEQMEVLSKAREKFGDTAQILVAMEELCELACVCAKYPRYDSTDDAKSELYTKAVDEVADVTIVLNHIVNILGVDSLDAKSRIAAKIERLHRWIDDSSKTMGITTRDREIIDTLDDCCSTCRNNYGNRTKCLMCEDGYTQYEPEDTL